MSKGVVVSKKEVVLLDPSFIKSPLEELVRIVKSTQKTLDARLISCVKKFEKIVKGDAVFSRERAEAQLLTIRSEIVDIEAQMEEAKTLETELFAVMDHRVDHLTHAKRSSASVWSEMRVYRYIADFLLREGLYDTAFVLADAVPGLAHHIDGYAYSGVKAIEAAMAEASYGPALEWCEHNAKRLQKLKSTFEFQLKRNIFFELIEGGANQQTALEYAREHFPKYANEHLREIQEAMALLVYSKDAARSKEILGAPSERLARLTQQFRRNNFALHYLSKTDTFSATLMLGASIYKTNNCSVRRRRVADCPTCDERLQSLVQVLPRCHPSATRLLCSISNKLMDEDNYPLLFPSGAVCSKEEVEKMEQGGDIRCPLTDRTVARRDLRRIYII